MMIASGLSAGSCSGPIPNRACSKPFDFLTDIVLGLKAGDVDRIELTDHGSELVRLFEGNAMLVQVLLDVATHREGVRRDEHHPYTAVVLHEVGERAGGTPAAKIAHQADGLAVDPAPALEAAFQGVDVEQRLGGVLILAAAGVDDRNRPFDAIHQCRGLGRHPRTLSPHDDHIDIRAESADAVFERLSLDLRGDRRIPDLAGSNPQEMTGVVEGEECARGRLGEVEHRSLVGKQRLQRTGAEPGFRVLPKPGGQGAEIVEQGAVELPRVEDMEEAVLALAQP